MQTLVYNEKEIHYDGNQLSPHWIYRNFDLLGDAAVAFVGKADVKLDHMVDLEDVKKKAPIYSPKMVHFLMEFFSHDLRATVLLQHLFTASIYQYLLERKVENLSRRGNDIYFSGRKLNVSIATKSLVSTLIHVGVNVQTEGTPVPTSGLSELGIDAQEFASQILNTFKNDFEIWQKANWKVIPR